MNTITVYFIPCEPTPANGYNIQWTVVGSGDPYTDAGNFTESPAVFTDDTNPDGTDYEGFIRSDCCGSGESGGTDGCFGNDMPWSTVVESGSGQDVGLGVVNGIDCDGQVSPGRIINVKFDGVSIPVESGEYPVFFGEGLTLQPTAQGNAILQVQTLGTLGSVKVVDSNGAAQCQNYTGSHTFNFPGFVIGAESFEVSIYCDPCPL